MKSIIEMSYVTKSTLMNNHRASNISNSVETLATDSFVWPHARKPNIGINFLLYRSIIYYLDGTKHFYRIRELFQDTKQSHCDHTFEHCHTLNNKKIPYYN